MIGKMKTFFGRFVTVPNDSVLAALFAKRVIEQETQALERDMKGVPHPEMFLGEGYGDPITWEHKDDLYVDFQILKHIVVDDVAFFIRYLNHELKEEEKQVYPYFYSPCFAEVKEVVAAEMRSPLLEISEEQSCYIAMFQNVMGLLLFSKSDVDDIKRRTVGFEDVPEKEHYQLTFMRFDQSVIDRLDFAGTVITHYEYSKKHSDPLRINFATYKENE
uniref:Uncharacterized protein n=1 Tax=Burkholderia phage vB_BgluM-SURPRISE13 TaxID=3159457 RepID=A0AAU7PF82_9VIRU